MDILKGINEKTVSIIHDLGNNFIEIKNYLDVGRINSSSGNFLEEGLYEACKKANIEFKKKKKLNFGVHIRYAIDIFPKENVFRLYCKEVGSCDSLDEVSITMKDITYENLITAYEIITKQYVVKVLNNKINDIIYDNKNIIK